MGDIAAIGSEARVTSGNGGPCRDQGLAKRLLSALAKYVRNTAGGVAVTASIATPALVGTVGVVSDFAYFQMKQGEMQSAADAAAIAAARELAVVQGIAPQPAVAPKMAPAMASIAAAVSGSPAEEVAKSYVKAALGNTTDDITTSVSVDPATGAVKVTVINRWQPFFAHYFGADITPIKADAVAGLVGESKICVIGLSNTGVGAVSMTRNSHLQAKGCGIYSNSTNSSGFYLGSGSTVDAALVCSAGGIYNKGGKVSTELLTDCPKVEDPLIGRAKPSYGACDYNKTRIMSGTVSLKPGVYCGGLEIGGTAKVTFEEGEYILKNSLFYVHDSASIKGSNVGFFLTGGMSLIQFWGNASIDLSGAEQGSMAGLLFFEDPANTYSLLRINNIRASNAFNLTGTIYFPKSNFLVDPTANVADKSAYTAIVAHRLIVENGPNLVLNTNYSATKVPVPAGIRSTSEIVLAE